MSGVSITKPYNLPLQHFIPNISPSPISSHTHVLVQRELHLSQGSNVCGNRMINSFCISHKDSSTIRILDTQTRHTPTHYSFPLLNQLKEHTNTGLSGNWQACKEHIPKVTIVTHNDEQTCTSILLSPITSYAAHLCFFLNQLRIFLLFIYL